MTAQRRNNIFEKKIFNSSKLVIAFLSAVEEKYFLNVFCLGWQYPAWQY